MRRREFSILLVSTAATWPLPLGAQQKAMPVIGVMSGRSPEDSSYVVAAFRQGLAEAGFVEGQNIAIEFRWVQGDYSRLPALATELVSRKPAVLVAVGGMFRLSQRSRRRRLCQSSLAWAAIRSGQDWSKA